MTEKPTYFGNVLKDSKYIKQKEEKPDVPSVNGDDLEEDLDIGHVASIVRSTVESAAHADRLNRFHSRQGHGYAAEQANDAIDTVLGENAQIKGDDNAKNGADRLVNGMYVQTKYYQDAHASVNAGFTDRGKGVYRYIDKNGNPMQLEVPSDQYEEAVEYMEQKIREGKVPGVSDPQKAKDLVRKGHVTYAQARAIAKAGTIDSLIFDSAHGAVIGLNALGISATIAFAQAVWNGESLDNAMEQAVIVGLKAGGIGFLIAVGTAQIARTGLNAALMTPSIVVVKALPSPVRHALVNYFRNGAPIYGAAATKNLAKLLRSNVIANAVAILIMSSGDIMNYFKGRVSESQVMAQMAVLTSSIAGGAISAAIATVLLGPLGGIAAELGTVAASIVGGALTGDAAQKLISSFHESDAQKMVTILNESFEQQAMANLLTQEEGILAVEELRKLLNGETLLCMFASKDRKLFADTIVKVAINNVIRFRTTIVLPSADEFIQGFGRVYEQDTEEAATVNVSALGAYSEERSLTSRLISNASGKGIKLSPEEIEKMCVKLKGLYAKRQENIIGLHAEACLKKMRKDEITYEGRDNNIETLLERLEEKTNPV